MDDNEFFRFGRAGYESEETFQRQGLFRRSELALPLGYWGNRPIWSDSPGPVLLLAGSGAGKLRDLLGYISTLYQGPSLDLDLKRELTAIGIHNQVRFGKHHYVFDPYDPRGCTINPLDILKPKSLSFDSDCQETARDLIPQSGSANAVFFEQLAQSRLKAVMKWLAHELGTVSFPDLYNAFNLVDTDPEKWGLMLNLMTACPYEDVRTEAGAMKRKKDSNQSEAIINEIRNNLSFMSDPALQKALSAEADVSLEALCDGDKTVRISLGVSPEHVGPWSPMLRTMFNTVQLYKARHPTSRRVLLLCDEAAQLGKGFYGLQRAFAYGRGIGLRAVAVFQDTGQIVENFGSAAVAGFFGNAETRILFGVRDEHTADSTSKMLGVQTLEYDDTLAQAGARRQVRQTVQGMLQGEIDPVQAGMEIRHYREASEHRSKQYRHLMTLDEVLTMPADQMLLFIGNLKPAKVSRYPYWTRREMAGQFFPNPYFPPTDRVRVRTRFGYRWRRVITERVPKRFAHLPQYADGTWSYIEGYRPR